MLIVACGNSQFRKFPRNFLVTLYLSQLDLVTDILYYYYSTFADVYLEYLALLFTALPIALLMLVGLLCYGALPSGQFAYRFRLRKVHLLLMYVVELPLMLLMLGWDTGMSVCGPLWRYRRQRLTQENVSNILLFLLYKVILFVVFITVHAVVAVVLSAWMLFLPLVWGIMVLLRLYILWPSAWLLLRRVFRFSLVALRAPLDQRVLAWGPRPNTVTDPEKRRVATAFVAQAIGFLFSASAERADALEDDKDDGGPDANETTVSEETQFFVMSVTLLFEFFVEAVPQISLQAYNNTLRNDWTPFAIVSIVVSGYIALEGIFRLLVMKYVFKRSFGSPKSFVLSDAAQKAIDDRKKARIEKAAEKAKLAEKRRQTRLAEKEAKRVEKERQAARKEAERAAREAAERAAREAEDRALREAERRAADDGGAIWRPSTPPPDQNTAVQPGARRSCHLPHGGPAPSYNGSVQDHYDNDASNYANFSSGTSRQHEQHLQIVHGKTLPSAPPPETGSDSSVREHTSTQYQETVV
eukprot:m.1034637 g.1034637  ORF g.1034637 m.1034637 type:complete len:527 (-) comp24135_c0_seq48:708-2288(-)